MLPETRSKSSRSSDLSSWHAAIVTVLALLVIVIGGYLLYLTDLFSAERRLATKSGVHNGISFVAELRRSSDGRVYAILRERRWTGWGLKELIFSGERDFDSRSATITFNQESGVIVFTAGGETIKYLITSTGAKKVSGTNAMNLSPNSAAQRH